jgi:Carboxypeptidase regulatory-like domain
MTETCSQHAAGRVSGHSLHEARYMKLRSVIVALLWLLTTSPAWAQFETASVVGTVHDSTGAVVPGATVTLTSIDTGVSASRTTNDSGLYEFVTVKAGLYIVTAEKEGFSSALVDNLQVQVGARRRVDLGLEVGRVSERIQQVDQRHTARGRLQRQRTSQHLQ